MKAEVFSELIKQLNRGESPDLALSVNDTIVLRQFAIPDRLILLGCGHVSVDVYRLARTLDFSVVAVDDRPQFANTDRFPEAKVVCGDFVTAIRDLHITERDYACVLTRGHKWDAQCIREVLSGTMPYYLGLISSRKRAEGLKEILRNEGFSQRDIDLIHAPIGLSIGAQTTAEIAVSICAELIAERHRHQKPRKENLLRQTNVNMDMLHCLADNDRARVMMIVLSSYGSTPVKSGSMMALCKDGRTFGTVGGGLGEAMALEKAKELLGSGQSAVLNIDMDNEVAADNDMVCGGGMTVLVEDIE